MNFCNMLHVFIKKKHPRCVCPAGTNGICIIKEIVIDLEAVLECFMIKVNRLTIMATMVCDDYLGIVCPTPNHVCLNLFLKGY